MRPKKIILTGVTFLFILITSISCRPEITCTSHSPEDAAWAEDQFSPDYRHLDEEFSAQSFQFTSKNLEELASLNDFSIEEGQEEVLFGLRGCQITDPENSGYSQAISLQETIPNHQDYQDVIGVWNQSTGEIAAYQGSTVPNWYYMCIQKEIGGHEANMLPTGRYIYQVSTHRNIEGAFRSEQEVVVLRSNDNLIFETSDDWEKWVPVDNIHPGGCPDEMFSSAGCQTLPGTFGTGCEGVYPEKQDAHLGTWGQYRTNAGLNPNNNQDRWEEEYIYILLTCREARLISEGANPDALNRLRFGSSSEEVLNLQQALLELDYDPGPLDGIMGPLTVMAYIGWQQSQLGTADGIVTPADANALGFELFP